MTVLRPRNAFTPLSLLQGNTVIDIEDKGDLFFEENTFYHIHIRFPLELIDNNCAAFTRPLAF